MSNANDLPPQDTGPADAPRLPVPSAPGTPSAATPPPAASLETGPDDHQLVLVKGDERYVFRCLPGDEPDLLNQLAALVSQSDNELTWFDAAVLSHQLGQRMARRLSSAATNASPDAPPTRRSA